MWPHKVMGKDINDTNSDNFSTTTEVKLTYILSKEGVANLKYYSFFWRVQCTSMLFKTLKECQMFWFPPISLLRTHIWAWGGKISTKTYTVLVPSKLVPEYKPFGILAVNSNWIFKKFYYIEGLLLSNFH